MDNEILNSETELTKPENEVTEPENTDNKETDSKLPESKKNKILEEIYSWIKTIVFALILAFIITQYIIVNAVVPSGSMETTVMTGDRLIANRLAYIFSEPQRYDIVVFKFPDDEETLFIKRIIGMPGETIEIKDGEVYVEGVEEPLRDDFVNGPMITYNPIGSNMYPMTIKIPKKGDNIADYAGVADSEVYDEDGDGKFDEDCYIMLGDNRNSSADSRLWNNMYLSKNKIEGKAIFRYWPFNTIGTIK